MDGTTEETIEAMRFLWTMVAVSAGTVDLLEVQMGPGGERFVYQDQKTGELINVRRARRWTDDEERRYVDELDRVLNGAEALDVDPIPVGRWDSRASAPGDRGPAVRLRAAS
jgi:hypothetical protein